MSFIQRVLSFCLFLSTIHTPLFGLMDCEELLLWLNIYRVLKSDRKRYKRCFPYCRMGNTRKIILDDAVGIKKVPKPKATKRTKRRIQRKRGHISFPAEIIRRKGRRPSSSALVPPKVKDKLDISCFNHVFQKNIISTNDFINISPVAQSVC